MTEPPQLAGTIVGALLCTLYGWIVVGILMILLERRAAKWTGIIGAIVVPLIVTAFFILYYHAQWVDYRRSLP